MNLLENIKNLQDDTIVALIQKDWKKPYFGAIPYIRELAWGNHAKQVYLYFLSNATTWRGETAKAVKTEIKRRIKENHYKDDFQV